MPIGREVIRVGDESIARLFAKQDEMNQKLAEIKAILQEREKACEIHRVTIADYGQRIRSLECWQSKQDGAGGLLKTWLPILFSAIALILTLRG